MTEKLTNSLIEKMKPSSSRYQVHDAILPNLYVRVSPTGHKSFYLKLPSKKRVLIGNCAILTVFQAREKAREILNKLAMGVDPEQEKKEQERQEKANITFGEFLDKHYAPWVLANRKSAASTLQILGYNYKHFRNKKVMDISIYDMEVIRRYRREQGTKESTINRAETALKAAISWGVSMELLPHNPITKLKKLKEVSSDVIVRYLSDDERRRLYAELDKRPTGQLKYAVLVSLNTGIRKGSLLSLDWSDVNFDEEIITLRAAQVKSGKTEKIPMNQAVKDALIIWREIQGKKGVGKVFPEDNSRNSWETVLKNAGISNFRWHDMRHDFASQLVMKGVDLNTVRELLGHSDLKMTMRYAHLAPEAKRQAVDLL